MGACWPESIYWCNCAKRRKQIWEALHPEDKQVCQVGTPVSKHGHAQNQGFAEATAEATGQAARTTRLAIARADALGDEALAKVVPDNRLLA